MSRELRLKCEVTVLVICPGREDAAHYAEPIDSGLPGYRFQARVLGPDDIPAVTDPRQAADHRDLAAMSVMVHGRIRKVIEAFATALAAGRSWFRRPAGHPNTITSCTELGRLEPWLTRAATAQTLTRCSTERGGDAQRAHPRGG
ncbi:hypothetical protein FE391_37325 [Nonomuraea sp. KC401]|uniref:hypothetical protein n=1 Tax=unclassified Nonomuraea TaxID=2593643 RepID=UPI0010FE1062|nr:MULTISPECIES: hypothetical protein [unclassified Nonomuraea]NBE99154.1 hypothetical protein [Nonomuraea sp. K271]TLF57710.1 hypothetical protein FE391_37325 [Nonomuraea sp. KC401]